jgi:hypothetical protein
MITEQTVQMDRTRADARELPSLPHVSAPDEVHEDRPARGLYLNSLAAFLGRSVPRASDKARIARSQQSTV